MEIDLTELDGRIRYKLLTGSVVPRPVAWLNTLNPDGTCNTAPFSFFNAVGDDLVVFSIGDRPDGTPKDTTANVRRTGEFVVNLIDEDTVEAMVYTSGDFPPGFQEATDFGLTLLPCSVVKAPRLAEAPIAFEGTLIKEVELPASRNHLFVGLVVRMHVREDIMQDNFKVDWKKYRPVGRLAGEAYTYCRDFFAITKPDYAQYLEDPQSERKLRRRPYSDREPQRPSGGPNER